MPTDLLTELLTELDSVQGRYTYLKRYATGTQPLAFISPESRKALGNRLSHLSVNICALAVSSLVERLRVAGFSDPRAWDMFTAADLDQLTPHAFSDALTYGTGFILVWGRDGNPVASVESPFQCAVLRDPGSREVVAGIKRYSTNDTTEAFVYLPDRVEHWRAPQTGPALAGFIHVETVEHNLGMSPLVPIDNGYSELDDLTGLTDSYNKLALDMMTASEAAGKPRRWISGLELTERPRIDQDGNPVVDGNGNPIVDVVSPINDVNVIQTMIAESPETRFGQLPASDLGGFKDGVQVILSAIMAVSALPAHYLGVLSAQPSSADALRASEAALTARAEARQLTFGRTIEQVGKLLLAVYSGTPVTNISLRVTWAPADTRSEAQLSDSVVKLVQANILPVTYALKKLGYSDDEIVTIRAAKRAEVLDGQGFGLPEIEQ